jgi:hypothetical protein
LDPATHKSTFRRLGFVRREKSASSALINLHKSNPVGRVG